MSTVEQQNIVRGAAPKRDTGLVATALATMPDAQRAMLAWQQPALLKRKGHPPLIALRALDFLRDNCAEGAELTTAPIAAAVQTTTNQLIKALRCPLRDGAVFARKKGDGPNSKLFWSLVDHSKVTPPQGANRDASAEQSHGAEGSESPNGRGTNGAPALGAAPVLSPADDGTVKRAWHLPFGPLKHAPENQSILKGDFAPEPEPLLVGGFAPADDAEQATLEPSNGAACSPIIKPQGATIKPLLGVSRISLTIEVATLHQAERVLQLVREMGT